ncbi:MAG: hypothetical protein DELT_00508 [Desulfovibrio sp.]
MPNNDPKSIAAQVEARVAAEKEILADAIKPKNAPQNEIDDNLILECLRANRVGDSTLFSSLYRGKFVYVKRWGRWLRWTGHHWKDDIEDITESAIEEVCRLYLKVADKKAQEAAEELDKDSKARLEDIAESAYRRVNMLRDEPARIKLLNLAHKIEYPLSIVGDELDKKYYHLACPNGVIDLRTGELHPGDPEDYILNACLTKWNASLAQTENPCPETENFLLTSMDGDEELVSFIWRLLGYGLIRERADHIFTIFWGEHGRNGKDTLIKLVTHVLGPTLSGDVPVEMFLAMQQTRSSSAPSPDVLALRGMCFAWINEAEEGQRFALAKLKKLTGGSFITARGLQDKLQTTWLQTHLPIMTTNELPKAKAEDAAFWHRAILLKWNLSFVDDPEHPHERKADKDLINKLYAEAEGVLIRMVRGATEYLKDGLQVPDKVKAWTKEQRSHWDDIGRFIAEWCVKEPECPNPDDYKTSIKATDLHDAFCIWYARNVDKRFSISGRKFGEQLNKKNIPFKRSNGIVRQGITLTTEAWRELEEARG